MIDFAKLHLPTVKYSILLLFAIYILRPLQGDIIFKNCYKVDRPYGPCQD